MYRKGEKVHESALGYNDLSAKTPMRQDQIFFIQSMTKPIVSVATLMLMEEGRLLLNDPVARFLPEFAAQQVATLEADEVKVSIAGSGDVAVVKITLQEWADQHICWSPN